MRFARKLAYALWVGICLVYGIAGFDRYRREAEVFEADIRRDHEVMGRGIVAAVAELWEDEGQKRALDIVARANARESQVQIRWVDLDAPPSSDQAPAAPREVLRAVAVGQPVNWTDPAGDGRLYSYVPLQVGEVWSGAIELSETLQPEHDFLRASLLRMLATFGSLALMSGLVAMALGSIFVGRPIRLLVEQARRVGAGDFDARLDLHQDDELGELAREMNAMSDRLAEARRRVEAESQARMQALDQLRHAERLTTVGKLASGVAHELGTPLNVIGVRAAMIADGEVEGAEARDGARIVREQTERITRIVRHLLDFARRRTPERGDHDLAGLIERSAAMLAPLARKAGARIDLDVPERPLRANVDPVQIQQVLANLVMNGLQAMSGGVLRITTRRVTVDAPSDVGGGTVHALAIAVQDEGVGMDAATLSQVFDPFFTTKVVGEGTGLGLSVAYGIIREHGGWIEVASELGAGTTFTVYLPEPT